ncbi:hypothetical protein AWH62_10900 [Maricaulis sp. W15]|uniref:tetratricopeptide repeat protein n=1 Tax=Maricaulis sp. W15 TaxID=1772333 RepID=UPI000948CAB8|nr:hypothetical protein [Maricaulis sp. W15]OLF72334.1 hypothetical protein AWH62_10900 [Maricaulis sp. W15]
MDRSDRPAFGAGWPRLAVAALILVLTLTTTGLPTALAQDDDRPAGVLSPGVGSRLLELIELEGQEAWSEAVAGYTALIDGRALSAYERAVLLRQRGRARYELDDMSGAISDWRTVISLAVLPDEEVNALRINTGQLLMVDGQYRAGINQIEAALARGVTLNADLAMRLAQAYAQDEDHDGGLPHARNYYRLTEAEGADGRQHFSVLLYYFQQLGLVTEQLSLMEEMVARWPAEKANWTSYASLLAQTRRESDAFEVNRIMYLGGMLTSSEELVRLAQYYSYYDYPYGGAVMLERELNAGRVEASVRNMQLLANLWRHAREWERALPVLERVATTSGIGRDYEAYGEALYRAARFSDAEAMFVQAINRGGLVRPGDTWTYVGNARMEQDDLTGATRAFRRALEWEYSRAAAQGWLEFIASKREILAAGERLERLTTIETCEIAIERARRQVVVSEDEYDSEGRRVLDIPAMCEPWFDTYGNRLPASERI